MPESKEKTKKPSKSDNEKLYGVLCYLGILIVVPLLDEKAKASDYMKFHINQGLVLIIASVVGSFVFWVPIIGWLAGLVFLWVWLVGLLGAVSGKKKRIPLLGNIELYK